VRALRGTRGGGHASVLDGPRATPDGPRATPDGPRATPDGPRTACRRPLVCALVVTVVAAAWSPARAKPLPDAEALAPAKLDVAAVDQAYRRARTRRNVGISIAIPGVALSIIGALIVAHGAENPYNYAKGIEVPSGLVALGVGVVVGIPGVVLWTLGQDDMDLMTWRRRQLVAPWLSARPAAPGFTLAF
jgi:hypothetical protein